jgi:GDPmannose 4,6-dehydratase
LVQTAFAYVGLPMEPHIFADPKLIRPAEVDVLVGDSSKARAKLGWTATVPFKEMIYMMVEADLERLSHLSKSSYA